VQRAHYCLTFQSCSNIFKVSVACTTNPIPAIYKPNPGDRNKRFNVCVRVELPFDGAAITGIGFVVNAALILRL